MIYPLRYYGDPVLRKVARPVTEFDDNLRELASDMLETMYHANGVGLAAPQIGLSKQMFVALELAPPEQDDDEDAAESDPETWTREEKKERWGVVAEHIIINPAPKPVERTVLGQEGCLSVPGLYTELIPRAERLTLRYQDLNGDARELEAEGHFARVLQHEYDHLEGVLFFERLDAEEKRSFMNEHRREFAAMQREAKAFLKDLKRGEGVRS